MCKKPLRETQMSDAAFVDQAATWSNNLVKREARGPGDLENAMRRLESRHGIPFSVLWSLRYRKPKGILSGTFASIRRAYEAECERQLRQLEHELEITKRIAGPDHAAVDEASAVVAAARAPNPWRA